MSCAPNLTYMHATPADAEVIKAILCQTLHFGLHDTMDWILETGIENFRVVKQDGVIVSCLSFMETGHWFGGKLVRAAGIRAVGVPPEHRGQGIAAFMMKSAQEELYRAGYPLSSLYPSTMTLYRKAGYERAGSRITYELSTKNITVVDRELTLERVPDGIADITPFKEIYDRRGQRSAGVLERSPMIWKRTINPMKEFPYRYFIKNGAAVEGYFVYTQGAQHEPVTFLDMVLLTRAAARRLLTFLHDSRSMLSTVRWTGGFQDPLRHTQAEQWITIHNTLDWMLRIVDIEKALRLRGYPRHLNLELHLDIRDDVLAANNGPFVLRLDDGEPTVKPGGNGRIKMDIRDFAPLYSGFMAPRELHDATHMIASEEELDMLQSVFGGPRPWMPNIF